jgi:hypothetical protein
VRAAVPRQPVACCHSSVVSESLPVSPLRLPSGHSAPSSRLPFSAIRFPQERMRRGCAVGTDGTRSPSEADVVCSAVAVDCRRAGLVSCGKPQPMRMPMCTLLLPEPTLPQWRHLYAHSPFGCAGHRSLPLMPTDRQTVLGHSPLHAPHALTRRRHIFTACPPPCVQLRIPSRRCVAARVCEVT